jgi:outer membrane lipoprotein-sorting protein
MANKKKWPGSLARLWEEEKSAMPADPAFDMKVLQEAAETYARAGSESRARVGRRTGRAIGLSSLLKWASLPAIAAALLLLLNPFGAGSVAWGEVVERIEKAPTLILNASIFVRQETAGTQKALISEMTVYCSRNYGTRIDVKSLGKEAGRLYIGPDNKHMTVLNLFTGTVERVADPDAAEGPGPRILRDPKRRVKELLSGPYRKIGKSRIDGRRVEGIEAISNKRGQAADKKTGEIKANRLWVDLKTGLPVREEMTIELFTGTETNTVSDFRWNVSLDPSLFQPPPMTKAPERK